MAVIGFTSTPSTTHGDNFRTVVWSGLATGDQGTPFEMPTFSDRSVQVQGTFGGCTVTIEGSNDGTNWHALNDPQGNPLAFTAAKVEQVMEVTRFIRPNVTAGAGTGMVITMIASRKGRV